MTQGKHSGVGRANENTPKNLGAASAALKQLAGEGGRGDRIKSAIDRAARAAGLSYWRAFDIWYGKARALLDSEYVAILSALTEKEIAEQKNAHHDLAIGLAKAEARLAKLEAALNGAVAAEDFETIEQVLRAIA